MSEQDKDSKTEEPTQKQKDKFREQGDVAKGRDLSAVVSLFAGTAAMILGWPIISSSLRNSTYMLLSSLDSAHEYGQIFMIAGKAIIMSVAPVALTVLLFGVIAELAQVGFMFTFKPMTPNFKKFNPITNLPKTLFSANTGIELIKSFVKLVVIGFFAVRVLLEELEGSGRLAGLSTSALLMTLASIVLRIVLHVGLALVVIAIIDLLVARRRHTQKMKMTKEQVKQEHKDADGDPLVKGQIKKKAAQMAHARMIDSVAEADVVVVNPTHYSVAIGYNISEDAAPKILAMGMDDLAMKIRERARQSSIPVVSDPPLARGIYSKGKVGGYIPAEYYRAVASLLAWVYRITGRVA